MNPSVRLSPRKNNERKMGKRKRTKGSSRRGVSLVHWFRNKGLRLDDNPALKEALVGAKTFRCVYILDPWFARSPNQGVNKWRFLLQCLVDLDSSLRKLNSRLFLIRGQPSDVFPKLFKEWGVNRLSFEEDPEVFGKQRDAKIKTLAATFQVQVITRLSHTLYDPKEILSVNSNSPPLTYKHFQYLISLLDPPPFPEDTITLADIEGVNTAIMSDHDSKYGLSSLEELGFDTEDLQPPVWIGGETVAKQRLDRHLERKAWVANFERPRMSSASLMTSPTGLGPYLRFGCLSPRLFYWRLTELYCKMKKTTDIPLYLHGQLYWREFFFTLGYNNAKLDQMIDNPICIPIPWEENDKKLQQWRNGETGFPWIDAIMIQLRQEGWIHPIARHAVACFLTRGDLWISWEEGAKVFEDLLLDADWSVNAGNWIWLSCSSFHQQFFHCYKFCPVMFSQQTDPNGDYVRKYIPALKNFSAKYIYNPWTAPLDVQEKAKCVIGKDYPLPMVNHDKVSRINSDRMNKILQGVARKPSYDESFTASTLHTKVQNRHRIPNMQKEPPRKLARLTQDHLSTHPNNYMPAQDDLTAGTSSYMQTQDDLTTGNNSYMPTQDELSVGTNSYLQTQDELTAGNNSYMQTQDELTAGTMSYMPTRDELTAGNNSYMATQNEQSAGNNSYMPTQDELTVGTNSYLQSQDDLTAGSNSYMSADDELTAGTNSYLPATYQSSIHPVQDTYSIQDAFTMPQDNLLEQDPRQNSPWDDMTRGILHAHVQTTLPGNNWQ